MRTAFRRPLTGVATLALAVTFAACGSDSSSDSGSAASSDSGIAVPDGIDSLTIATDPTYAPNEFIDPKTKDVIGMDVDLGKAIGEKLGLTVTFEPTSFDSIIPGLASSKYDLGMSSFTDTKEREATVDFVTYFSAGTSFYAASDGPDVTAIEDLCGKKVGVQKGTTQAEDAQAQAKKCDVKVLVYPGQDGVNLALSSDRVDVAMADSPVAAYQVEKSDGAFKLTGDPYGTAPYGIAIPKDSGLAEPILAAVKALMEDGTYTKVLDTWGLADGAITDPVINGATS